MVNCLCKLFSWQPLTGTAPVSCKNIAQNTHWRPTRLLNKMLKNHAEIPLVNSLRPEAILWVSPGHKHEIEGFVTDWSVTREMRAVFHVVYSTTPGLNVLRKWLYPCIQMIRGYYGKHVETTSRPPAVARHPSRQRQNVRHFTDKIFKSFFLKENVWISIDISLKFVPKGTINNNPALVQIMAWHWSGYKPLSEAKMVSLLMHICHWASMS